MKPLDKGGTSCLQIPMLLEEFPHTMAQTGTRGCKPQGLVPLRLQCVSESW